MRPVFIGITSFMVVGASLYLTYNPAKEPDSNEFHHQTEREVKPMTTSTQAGLLPIGGQAPDFKDVLATGNRRISLSDYTGKFLIMVFYPKDQTPGCTQQLCALRDDYTMFQGLNTDVIGVNPDSLESHERFVEKQSYPFPILVDEGAQITRAYGAQRPEGGVMRTVYVVGPDGTIVFAQQGMPTDAQLADTIQAAQ